MYLDYVANIAEIIAGIAILYSVVKVWPMFNNLDQIVKREKDWSVQLGATQSGLTEYSGSACPQLLNAKDARDEIFRSVIQNGGSDIRIEVKQTDDHIQGSIRFRKDGHLKTICFYDVELHNDLISEFKKFGGLSTEPLQSPILGRGRFDIGRKKMDFRMQLAPTMLGECIFLRVLDPTAAKMPYSALGIGERNLNLIKQRLAGGGLIVFGGPTGSGKIVSFYTSLDHLDDEALNIISVEDPIEVELPNIIQLEVKDRPGHRFEDMMNVANLSDPDVLVVGEIRSETIAGQCLRAAKTGHLVMSCIHTPSLMDTLLKLDNWTNDALFPAITLINQRLARRICSQCSVNCLLSSDDEELVSSILQYNLKERSEIADNFKSPVGCDECNEGYKGRIAGYEVLDVNQTLIDALDKGAGEEELWAVARESGTTTVGFNILQKASEGDTSLAELRRITAPGQPNAA